MKRSLSLLRLRDQRLRDLLPLICTRLHVPRLGMPRGVGRRPRVACGARRAGCAERGMPDATATRVGALGSGGVWRRGSWSGTSSACRPSSEHMMPSAPKGTGRKTPQQGCARHRCTSGAAPRGSRTISDEAVSPHVNPPVPRCARATSSARAASLPGARECGTLGWAVGRAVAR
jgi:hypothetical protein